MEQVQGGDCGRIEPHHRGGRRRHLHGPLKMRVAKLAAQHAGHGLRIGVPQGDLDRQIRAARIGQRQPRGNQGAFEDHRPRGGQIDVRPDADVAAADAGNPVPAGGRVEARVVHAERAAVGSGLAGGLFADAAGRRRLVNTHRQGVERAGAGERGDVKAPPQKGAVDAAQVGAVEIDLGLPVDAVKIEPEFPAGSRSGKGELVAVPEVRVEEGIRDLQLVVAIVRIRQRARVQVAHQRRSRHGGREPVLAVRPGLRERLARRCDQRVALDAP